MDRDLNPAESEEDEWEDVAMENEAPQPAVAEESEWEDISPEEAANKASPFKVDFVSPEQLKAMSTQEKMEYAQDLERQRSYLLGKGALKGIWEGLTLGDMASKDETDYGYTPFSAAASAVPAWVLAQVFGPAFISVAARSPVLTKQAIALAELLGVGAAGATEEGFRKAFKGEELSLDDMLGHGTMWMALHAGLNLLGKTASFFKNLLSKSEKTGETEYKVLTNTINEMVEDGVNFSDPEATSLKALEILKRPATEAEKTAAKMPQVKKPEIRTMPEVPKPDQITPADLSTKKISQEKTSQMMDSTYKLSQPYPPENIDFRFEAESLEKNVLESEMEGYASRAATEEELGTGIKESIEKNLAEETNLVKPFYKQAQQAAEGVLHNPKKSVELAGDALIKLERGGMKTRPPEYANAIKNLENSLEDMGYQIIRDEAGNISQIIQKTEVTAAQSIDLKQRLNSLINYESKDPNVKNILRPVVRALKQDIKIALEKTGDGLAAFELAEEQFARTAKRFNRDAITNIRNIEAGEKVAKKILNPTDLADIKSVVSPNQWKQVEREIMEKIKNQNYSAAKKTLREIGDQLSPEAREISRTIVESKNPYNPSTKISLLKEGVLNDVSNAFTTGARPNKTLDLWKTKQGRQIVKDTFKDSPNWPEVENYLQKQSFSDMFESVLNKEGKIDYKKFEKMIKDPLMKQDILDQGGREALTFFENLESTASKFNKNMQLIEKIPTLQQSKSGQALLEKYSSKIRAGERRVERVAKEGLEASPETMDKIYKIKRQKPLSADEATRGQQILERMAKKDYPAASKIRDWKAFLNDTLGMRSHALLSIFGVLKLGLAKTVPVAALGLIGDKIMMKMLTSPRVRKAFIEASKKYVNPIEFIMALKSLESMFDEEEEEFVKE